MTNETIGNIPCPICNKTADVRASKKAKAYIHCEDCGFQGFARGFQADNLLRAKMTKVAGAAEAEAVPMVTIEPAIKDKPKPAAEKTIFDILGSMGKGGD